MVYSGKFLLCYLYALAIYAGCSPVSRPVDDNMVLMEYNVVLVAMTSVFSWIMTSRSCYQYCNNHAPQPQFKYTVVTLVVESQQRVIFYCNNFIVCSNFLFVLSPEDDHGGMIVKEQIFYCNLYLLRDNLFENVIFVQAEAHKRPNRSAAKQLYLIFAYNIVALNTTLQRDFYYYKNSFKTINIRQQLTTKLYGPNQRLGQQCSYC